MVPDALEWKGICAFIDQLHPNEHFKLLPDQCQFRYPSKIQRRRDDGSSLVVRFGDTCQGQLSNSPLTDACAIMHKFIEVRHE